MFIKIKTSFENLQNMIETQEQTQDNDQIYGGFNVAMRNIAS